MKISCPGMARARVWFEDNREITIKDGVLADRFATYGVHVYELEP